MAIPTAQLETWGKQGGPTGQFTSTYETIKGALENSNAPYANKAQTVFLQGSYQNNTNVYGDSDVDVVIRLESIFYPTTLSNLSADGRQSRLRTGDASGAVQYTLLDFKRDVIDWLTKKYGFSVKPGGKAVYIEGAGTRRNADVLVAANHRRYYTFT